MPVVYERIIDRPYLKELAEEHGAFILIREGERQLRQFADGYFTQIDQDGTEMPCSGWQGPKITRGVEQRQMVFLHESMKQAEQRLTAARDELRREISEYVDTGNEIENFDAKKQKLARLKEEFNKARFEYDRDVLAPGRAMRAMQEKSRASQESAKNARAGKMEREIVSLEKLFADQD